jgi:hypothetical protein
MPGYLMLFVMITLGFNVFTKDTFKPKIICRKRKHRAKPSINLKHFNIDAKNVGSEMHSSIKIFPYMKIGNMVMNLIKFSLSIPTVEKTNPIIITMDKNVNKYP